MSEASDETAEFAALLRKVKDRSGLSYGVLAKRLHMSTSTLHRYCNGDAVPTEFTPVERFARVCRATPQELMDLRQRWQLADESRKRRPQPSPAEAEPGPAAVAPEPSTAAAPTAEPAEPPEPPEPAKPAEPVPPVVQLAVPDGDQPDRAPLRTGRARRFGLPAGNRRRVWLIAGAALALVLGSLTVVVGLTHTARSSPQQPSEVVSESPAGQGVDSSPRKPTPTPSARPSSTPSPSTSRTPTRQPEGEAGSEESTEASGTPLTVSTRPHAWEDPCTPRYLVDRPPAQVPPPPTEQDAPGWVGALGAVSAGEQRLELTLQGTGKDTVVLQSLHLRVVGSRAPLAWNNYDMGYRGVGCGGSVATRSFDLNLESGSAARPKAGQRGFPYKVSESDPEVLYVTARTDVRDVSWYLDLKWSSGDRQGTLQIDDNGKPFRTSGAGGRPAYDYVLDDDSWATMQPDEG